MSNQANIEKLGGRFWLRDVLQSGYALKLVKNAGLTFEEVGEVCGVSKSTAWHWLQGHTQRPRPAHALQLARLLQHLEVITHAR